MAPPSGSSSSRTSSPSVSFSVDTTQALDAAGVDLLKSKHCIVPSMVDPSGGISREAVTGLEHKGIEWISVKNLVACGDSQLKLIYNATPLFLRPWGTCIATEDTLQKLSINYGDLTLMAPPPGIGIPIRGRAFPPGSLQILLDPDTDQQVVSPATTLPAAVMVDTIPCSGWRKRQHIYAKDGMEELAVVIFDSGGSPIACRENLFNEKATRVAARWWQFNYSRPKGFQS
jgi:hypothetical protein